jgi:hypothetical protein
MNLTSFIDKVLQLAKENGWTLEHTQAGLRQIDFGHKKLHENHLKALYPTILEPKAHIPSLINKVAPGRPCTHKPMRIIITKVMEGRL